MRKSIIFSFLGLALAFTSCKKEAAVNEANSDKNTQISGTIEVDGSSTVAPVTEAVAEEFEETAPKVGVNIGVSGTGGGFKKFVVGSTDISNASRPIKDKEKVLAEENGIKYLELEVAYDGLAVVVSKSNTWVDKLTVEELKKMWEPDAEGKITNWSQIRDGFPDEEIKLFGPGTDSGTYDYFTEAIVDPAKGAAKSRSDFNASEDDHILVEGVSGDKSAIGFFGLAYYEENKEKLKLVPIDNGTETVSPSLETVKNGTYAPLSRPLFIYVNNKAASKPEVQAFVNFYLDNAGELSKEVGYIPLPEEKYNAQKESFNSFINN